MEIIPLSFDSITPESLDGANIRKHNDLIEAKYQLPSLQEQRIILMLLAQIKMSDEDFKCYRITVADFSEILGIRVDGMYEELERTLKSLMARVISIKNGKSFLIMSWLSSAEYKSGSGYIELAFDPKLKPYLLQLKDHYTQYQLGNAIHFKSIYSIRLYELLKKESFKSKNGSFNVFFEYEQLRENFGIGKKEYEKFKDFRVKTIDPATREISDKTDLYINDVRYGKTGRKITNITFSVQLRTENETKLRQANLRIEDIKPEKDNDNHPIIETLMSHGFSLEIAKKCQTKHGIKKIERNLAYTLAKKQEGLVKDVPAYLNKAIENDYGGAWEVENQKKAEVQQKAQKEKAEKDRLEQVQKSKEEQLNQVKKIMYQEALDKFLKLPVEQQEAIKSEFIQETDSFTVKKMKELERNHEDCFSSPIVAQNFKIFLIQKKYY
jgi:plasmid replication initiation protein